VPHSSLRPSARRRVQAALWSRLGIVRAGEVLDQRLPVRHRQNRFVRRQRQGHAAIVMPSAHRLHSNIAARAVDLLQILQLANAPRRPAGESFVM
jgi:hypothetical protein